MYRRPILRWHGGKWRWIIAYLPSHRVYVEPSGGAASVLLRKPRSYAEVYNDLDGEVVNLFRVVRDQGDALRRLLEATPFARAEFDLSYQPASDALEQARRTAIRSLMGFGTNLTKMTRAGPPMRTGFRACSIRSGTTPADWHNYPAHLADAMERLRGVVIENRPAIEVMQAHDGEQTVHYVDPPYVASMRDRGDDYRHELTDADHAELAGQPCSLRGAVVLSGYRSPLYDGLYRGWRCIERQAYADGARARVECLWLSPPRCPPVGWFDAVDTLEPVSA